MSLEILRAVGLRAASRIAIVLATQMRTTERMLTVDVIRKKVVPLQFSEKRSLVDTGACGTIMTLNESRTSA